MNGTSKILRGNLPFRFVYLFLAFLLGFYARQSIFLFDSLMKMNSGRRATGQHSIEIVKAPLMLPNLENEQRLEAFDLSYQEIRLMAAARAKLQPYATVDRSFVDSHPALTPMIPEFAPLPIMNRSFPMINVLGLAKAGTSQLYNMLAQHPSVNPYHRLKEYCPKIRLAGSRYTWGGQLNSNGFTSERRSIIQKALFQTFASQNNLKKSVSDQGKITVNGCLNYPNILLQLHYAKPQNRKFLILLRDPADWLWATWNFWYDGSMLDAQAPPRGDWATVPLHYRSPELFHEVIQSAGKLRSALPLLNLRKESVDLARTLKLLMGDEAVLLLRNEDMLPRVVDAPHGFLEQLSNFTNLARHLFPASATHTMTNCNTHKGTAASCGNVTTSINTTEAKSSAAYPIANNRSMLAATRKLIYMLFWEECKVWRDEFRIVYPDCLNVMEDG